MLGKLSKNKVKTKTVVYGVPVFNKITFYKLEIFNLNFSVIEFIDMIKFSYF